MPIDPTKINKINKTSKEVRQHPDTFKQTIDERPDLVTVGFDGLGICSFSETEYHNSLFNNANKLTVEAQKSVSKSKKIIPTKFGRCETSVIRKEHHQLTMVVQSFDSQGNRNDFIEQFHLPNDVTITIRALENPQIDSYLKYEPLQNYNRQSLSQNTHSIQEKHDLRWLLDIESAEFYGTKLKPKISSIPLSKLFIENAEFYCRALLLKSQQNQVPMKQTIKKNLNQSYQGYIGHELGAKIPADKVLIKIESSTLNQEFILWKNMVSDEARFFIKISNSCNGIAENGDFSVIYDFFETSDSNTFTVVPSEDSTNSEGVKRIKKPNSKEDPEPPASSYVRFCGAFLAGKQNGINGLFKTEATPNTLNTNKK